VSFYEQLDIHTAQPAKPCAFSAHRRVSTGTWTFTPRSRLKSSAFSAHRAA